MSKSLERRRRDRYSMEMEVQFLVLKYGKTIRSGNGLTRDVSANGIFLKPPRRFLWIHGA
jgi:hypothetical protein